MADLAWIAFNGIMIWESLKVMENLRRFKFHSPALGLSMEFVYWIFPISFALMTLRIIQINFMQLVLKIELQDVDKVTPEELDEKEQNQCGG